MQTVTLTIFTYVTVDNGKRCKQLILERITNFPCDELAASTHLANFKAENPHIKNVDGILEDKRITYL